MREGEFENLIRQNFSHQPTSDQIELIRRLEVFLKQKGEQNIMVVRGYAGTGKTSLIASLVNVLPKTSYRSQLLAPTGRAAKVLSSYAKKQAFTIHKVIYQSSQSQGKTVFSLRKNIRKNTVYIVDEASMIGDNTSSGSGSWSKEKGLLDDLITYVFSGVNCRLILVGDDAQLPPVHLSVSPAMDLQYLQNKLLLKPNEATLKEVIRQEKSSGILYNATRLRNQIDHSKKPAIKFDTASFEDLTAVNGPEVQELLEDAYHNYGEENTIVLCRSNKRAHLYNQQIRLRIKWLEDEIAAGDLMMVVKNNYFWLDDTSSAGFIANGDIIEILSVRGVKEIYGFRFADITMRMIDYPDMPDLEVKILMDSISSERASISSEQSNALYHAVMEDYLHIGDKRKRYLEMRKDPYLNALQVKFSYAITCHKSQGGQWEAVFIDQGYLTEEMINVEYLRWLYTAMTRASKKLYFVNFHPRFFN